MENSTLLPRPMVLDEFTPFVGRTLLADCNPRPAELTLVEASPLRHQFDRTRLSFIAIFRSSCDILLMSGNYVMRAAGFGPAVIYISQISAPQGAPDGHYYQAIFN